MWGGGVGGVGVSAQERWRSGVGEVVEEERRRRSRGGGGVEERRRGGDDCRSLIY